MLELDEGFWLAHNWLGASYANRGRFADAARSYERAFAWFPTNAAVIGCLAGYLARTSQADRAAQLLDRLGDGTAFGAPFGLTNYYLARGELDRAADWFERGIAQRDTRMTWIAAGHYGDRLTSSPYWDRLAKLMNLPARP